MSAVWIDSKLCSSKLKFLCLRIDNTNNARLTIQVASISLGIDWDSFYFPF